GHPCRLRPDRQALSGPTTASPNRAGPLRSFDHRPERPIRQGHLADLAGLGTALQTAQALASWLSVGSRRSNADRSACPKRFNGCERGQAGVLNLIKGHQVAACGDGGQELGELGSMTLVWCAQALSARAIRTEEL